MSNTFGLTMEEAFDIFTVAQLKDLCKMFGIVKVSALKKAEIIHILVGILKEKETFQRFLFMASPEELKAFEKMMKEPLITENDYDDLMYFMMAGYGFITEDGRGIVFSEIEDLYHGLSKDYWKRYHRFHQLYQYLMAAVHLYGVITIPELVHIFNQQNEIKTSRREIQQIYRKLNDRSELMNFIIENELIFDEIMLESDNGYYAYEMVYEQQGSGPYYVPEKKRFLLYAKEDYFERTSQYTRLYEYMTHVFEFRPEEAEDLCEDAMHSIHLGYLADDILSDMKDKGVTLDLFHKQDLEQLIDELIQNTRSIFCKGFTPNEVKRRLEYKTTNDKKQEDSNVVQFPEKM